MASCTELILQLKDIDQDIRTKKYLHQDSKGELFLNMDALREDLSAEKEYREKVYKLMVDLDSSLISAQGQHSGTYYEMLKAGVTLVVTEKDSFGPLAVKLCCPGSNWAVYYG